MSEENVEVVRQLYDAYERDDLATVYSIFDEEVEWDIARSPLADLGLAPIYRGHEGVRQFWREWFAVWGRVEFSYDEFIDAGEKVLVVLRQRMRGKLSGIELSMDSYVQAWTLSEGKVARMEFFPTREDALKAAGLSE
jgi:ketosteroid isomerase-like protein